MRHISSEDVQQQRQRLQDEITSIESRVRRRLRGKIVAAGSFDADDVIDSARRRLDRMLVEGRLPVQSDAELDAYIGGVAEKVALEKTRKHRRQVRVESFIALQRGRCLEPPHELRDDEETLQSIIRRLDDSERQVLTLWVHGLPQQLVAMTLHIGVESYKSRRRRLWSKIRTIAPSAFVET